MTITAIYRPTGIKTEILDAHQGWAEVTGLVHRWVPGTDLKNVFVDDVPAEEFMSDDCNCVLPEHSCSSCRSQRRRKYGDRIPF
jgi:hypothetical protein